MNRTMLAAALAAIALTLAGCQGLTFRLPPEGGVEVGLHVGSDKSQKTKVSDNTVRPNPPPPTAPLPVPPPPVAKTLVIDKIVMNHTPQSNGWCLFLEFNGKTVSVDTKSRDNSGNDKTIPLNLQLPGVVLGETIAFKVYLDDNFSEVQSNAEDRSKGEFRVTAKGAKTYRFDGPKGKGNFYPPAPETSDSVQWDYKIFWHVV